MHHREFFEHLDEKSLAAAIGRAEVRGAARVRVFVSHQHVDDAMEAARVRFHLMGMDKTHHRNGVLVFVAPESRKFAIFGDEAIHQKCGDHFWDTVRDETIAHFKAGQFNSAIIHAVDRVGEKLAEHFAVGVRKG